MITVLALCDLLCNHFGTTMFSFWSRTNANSLRKNATDGSGKVNAYYKNVVKVQKVSIMTDFDVQKRTDKLAAAAGVRSHKIGPAVNGSIHIEGTPLKITEDHHVLFWCEVKCVCKDDDGTDLTQYTDATTGLIIPADYFKPFYAPRKPGTVPYYTYGLETITALAIGGHRYEVDTTTYPEAQYEIVKMIDNGKLATA